MNVDYKINRPAEIVYEHLTDMEKFVKVHPVIYRIDHLSDKDYLIFEKLKFGFIPYSFTYYASVDGNRSEQTVTMKATVMKIIKIEMFYKIKTENDQTLVNETINFKSFLPVKFMMQKIFREQHLQLFLNIEKESL
jgi:carbon monoxide dehydrogenase subunit G